ncbi:MAG: ABC transporter permease [Micrococcales bacterium]|nr:ABC transporter permease [Micrococcales bacterium]
MNRLRRLRFVPAALRRGGTRRADDFRFRDALSEATAGVGARTGRLLLTVAGTVLGIAAVVVAIGLGQTSQNRINEKFDAVAARHAAAEPETRAEGWGEAKPIGVLPWDAAERAERVAGVRSAATISKVDIGDATVTAVSVHDPSAAARTFPTVVATSGDALEAFGAHLEQGRYFDSGHDSRADRVAVLGIDAAERLGVGGVASLPSVFIGDDAYQVIGIIDTTDRRSVLLASVIIPQGTAAADFDLSSPAALEMLIDVGAGPVIAEQMATTLAPTKPKTIKVATPGRPSALQGGIQSDLVMVFLALGGVALLIGGVGIANVTLLSVMERAGEIGLRRALGARRRDVATQFVIESVIVGGLGGLIGSALGVAVVTAVSAVRQWTPILDLRMVAGAAVAGVLIGLLAGLYPAIRAARMEPVAALRTGV